MQENKQEKSPIKKRILHYLDLKGITKYAFYRDSGVTRGILDQPTGISEENITKFLSFAQDISPNWLLTGEGKIFEVQKTGDSKSGTFSSTGSAKGHIYQFDSVNDLVSEADAPYLAERGNVTIPIVHLSTLARRNAEGGTINSNSVLITLPGRMLKPGPHACISIQGQAMSPTLQEGGFLVCRLLKPQESKKPKDKQIYIVVSQAGETFIRRLRTGNSSILCLADNPDKATFADFHLSPNQIRELWEVEWYFAAELPNLQDSYSNRLQGMEEDIDSLKQELATLTRTLKST